MFFLADLRGLRAQIYADLFFSRRFSQIEGAEWPGIFSVVVLVGLI